MIEVNQILPNMAYGDAISNHAIELKRLLKSWGYSSEIYAWVRESAIKQYCQHLKAFKPSPHSLTLYHYSVGSDEVTRAFLKAPGRKILIYHNITPHHYFKKYSGVLYELLEKGRANLPAFKDVVDFAIGDSQYNVEELLSVGYKKAEAIPILLDLDQFKNTEPDPALLKYLDQGWTTFLFTGRIAPNKAQQDLIRTFARYYHNVERKSRLLMVGGSPYGSYQQELYQLAETLGVRNNIFIPGHVSFPQLIAYYKAAHIFLCMSEHEGFCVPLLEAMNFDLPIIAYSTTGVPYTLGNAGVLLKEKNYTLAAEMAHLLMQDENLRNQIIATQRKRLADFQPHRVAEQYRRVIQEFACG